MSRRADLHETFRALPLFAHCTDEELDEIDSLADEVHIEAGREIVRQGELGREFVVIVEGRATVSRDGVTVAELGPGDHVGELSLLDDRPRNATVAATTDLVVQVLDRRAFQTLLEDSPHLTLNLLRALAARLGDLDEERSSGLPDGA